MVKEIQLSNGQVTTVDDTDFGFLSEYVWHTEKSNITREIKYYAVNEKYRMHRLIMERVLIENKDFKKLELFKKHPRKYQIDHINHDTLDNTRNNLRIVSTRKNHHNRVNKSTSIFPGVSKESDRTKWRAQIRVNGINKHIGRYNSEIEAYLAYKMYAINLD